MGVQQDVVIEIDSQWESDPLLIGIQRWNKAEKVAQGIISNFQPTIVAESKRDAVINYLQRLLKTNLDCEVFAYGSVPLKTYLPDGDIDLSAIGASTHDLINKIRSLLRSEGENSSAEFVVKDVQLIGAEVKVVKCMVQNLVVDISVNQIGGLCTLCFLEQVDRVIKKDHLFKRSIILIKAWCYFESRTLGAHVGLISTYGLETLVLYIFHIFHIVLDGPLSVLYKFLEYFSTFDWDNYGISLMGPVRLSDLPRIVAERPLNSNNLLLKVGFLRRCSETLSIPMRHGDFFPKKHLNIFDPLNNHNNLGRSVSQGNFFRIRSAFGYGARKLGQILVGPEDNLAGELILFFSNTLNMHRSGQRPDHIPRSSWAEKTFTTEVTGEMQNCNDENSYIDSGNRVSSKRGSVNKTDDDEEVVPSEALDLTGDLMSHLACLDHVRGWNGYVFAPPGTMMGQPPPPPPILLTMIASEHGSVNGVVPPHPRFYQSDLRFMSRPPFGPNDHNPRAAMPYFQDMNRSRHGYHPSTSTATTNGTPNHYSPPEFVAGSQAVHHREPLLHRRRHHNPNRGRQPDGTQRPRPVSGMDRFTVQSSYHLRDEDDFPPLSG